MGHPPRDVWGYTPRQIHAFVHFARKRQARGRKDLLHLHAMGARGKPEIVNKMLRETAE